MMKLFVDKNVEVLHLFYRCDFGISRDRVTLSSQLHSPEAMGK